MRGCGRSPDVAEDVSEKPRRRIAAVCLGGRYLFRSPCDNVPSPCPVTPAGDRFPAARGAGRELLCAGRTAAVSCQKGDRP